MYRFVCALAGMVRVSNRPLYFGRAMALRLHAFEDQRVSAKRALSKTLLMLCCWIDAGVLLLLLSFEGTGGVFFTSMPPATYVYTSAL